MALRPRNIALEGLAPDFYSPSSIAVVGFSTDEEGAVSVDITEVSPAQTGFVVATGLSAGDLAALRSWLKDRDKPKHAPVSVRIETESPAQSDAITATTILPCSVTLTSESPAQTSFAQINEYTRLDASAFSESPAQSDAITAAVFRARATARVDRTTPRLDDRSKPRARKRAA